MEKRKNNYLIGQQQSSLDYLKGRSLITNSTLSFPALIHTFPSELPPSHPNATAWHVYFRRGNSIKSIYRLYSCSLPGTFSNGTLGTGFCESCRPDSRPGWRERETERETKKKFNVAFYFERRFSACYPPRRPISR